LNAKDKQAFNDKGDQHLFKDLMPIIEEPPVENPPKKKSCCTCLNKKLKQPLTYMRLILNGNQGVNEAQVFTDNLELNSLMPKYSELTKICNMTEKYVIFSISLLYAGLCPIATVVVALFLTLDSIIELAMDLYVM
jgi:hypothetical protein